MSIRSVNSGPRIVLLLIGLFFNSQALGQDDLLRFLSLAQDDVSAILGREPATSNQSIGWFDEPEARVSTGRQSGSGPSQQQTSYALRMKPILGSQRVAERRLRSLASEQQLLQNSIELNDALLLRYTQLIDLLAMQMQIDYLEQEVELSSSKVEFDQSLVQTTDFNPERLQELELEQFQLQQQLQLRSSLIDATLREIGATRGMATLLESSSTWLISSSELLQESSPNAIIGIQSMTSETRENLNVRNSMLALRLEEQELVKEKAEKNPLVKFVELKYTDRDARGSKETETTLGFSIPFGNRNYGFIKEERDIADARTDLLIERRDAIRSMNQHRSSLRLFSEHSAALQTMREYVDEKLQQSLNSGNPRLLLSLQEQLLDVDRQFSELVVQSMRDYIGILHTSGRLTSPPLRNWLRASR